MNRFILSFCLFLLAPTTFADNACESFFFSLVKGSIQTDDFKAAQPRPGLIYLEFEDQKVMASLLMRFQEHAESPFFKGKVFSRKEFRDWYRASTKNNKFTYYEEWDGFNFPIEALDKFFNGHFQDLTLKEKNLIKFLRPFQKTKTYIIAWSKKSERSTLPHEFAHALFYLDANYRSEILTLLQSQNIEPVKEALSNELSAYHKDTLIDEVHAWLMFNEKDLAELGLDIGQYSALSRALRDVFERYRSSMF